MVENRDSRKIVGAVIGLGQSLGLTVVAEGIETAAQADLLISLGCDLGQGWLFGHPLTGADVPSLLQAIKRSAKPRERLDLSINQRLAQLEAVYESAPVALCFIDQKLRVLKANRRFATLVKLPLETLVGRTVAEIASWALPYIKDDMRLAIGGHRIVSREYPIPGTDRSGQSFVEAAHDEDGELLGVSLAIVDITNRSLMVSTLQDCIAHQLKPVEMSPQFQWLADIEGNIYERDMSAEAFSGVTAEKMTFCEWAEFVHPEDVEWVKEVWADAFRKGHPINIDFRWGVNLEQTCWIRMRVTPRFDSKGKILHWHGSSEDVTDQRQLGTGLQKMADLFSGESDGV